MGLALVLGKVEKARQGSELDVEGGGELHGQGVFATLAGEELLAAVEPYTAEERTGGEGSDAVGAWPVQWPGDASRPSFALWAKM
jgi:hypothetical protein